MAICRATKANGEPCTLSANGPQGFCWAHDPANREKRRRMASRAAKSKPGRELAGVKTQLQDLTEQVLSGALETGPAAVANQLINTRLRAIELERKIKETEDLEERLEALEHPQKGGRQWGG
jgi:septal ring factor EnvC (AmiA/AmiB activator)